MNPDDNSYLQTFVRQRAQHLGFLWVLCRREDEAEELFQELAVQVMETLSRYDPALGEFDGWVRGIARNLYRESCRKRGRQVTVDPTLAAAIAGAYESRPEDESAANEDLLLRLRQCLDRLSTRHREVIRARYELRHSSAQVASALGKSVNAIDSLVCRLRSALIDCVQRSERAS